jgi:hypothetical protein
MCLRLGLQTAATPSYSLHGRDSLADVAGQSGEGFTR